MKPKYIRNALGWLYFAAFDKTPIAPPVIDVKALENVNAVELSLKDKNVILRATKEEALARLPLNKWRVVHGRANWFDNE